MNDQPAERPKKPAPQLADYPHRVAEIIRFGDLDPQGHVNQAVFLTYFESGRVAMFRNPDLSIGVPGITYVMVRMEVDYMKELHWPGNLEIGTGVAEFGRSSFKAAQGHFPRRRLRGRRPGDAGLHGSQDAQSHAAAAGRDRTAEPVEDEKGVGNRAYPGPAKYRAGVVPKVRRNMAMKALVPS